jgi:hypothetical protein
VEGFMKWITREHVKADRVACPWLIKKFVDHFIVAGMIGMVGTFLFAATVEDKYASQSKL